MNRKYTSGKIDSLELTVGYRKVISTGADIIEADLGIEAGNTIETLKPKQGKKEQYFQKVLND